MFGATECLLARRHRGLASGEDALLRDPEVCVWDPQDTCLGPWGRRQRTTPKGGTGQGTITKEEPRPPPQAMWRWRRQTVKNCSRPRSPGVSPL